MDRQTLRDWVIRFNEQGPDGLINIASPGAPAKLQAEHRAFLGRLVEEGPIPAVHGVVRWRACDLIALVQEEFGMSVSDDTIYLACRCTTMRSLIELSVQIAAASPPEPVHPRDPASHQQDGHVTAPGHPDRGPPHGSP